MAKQAEAGAEKDNAGKKKGGGGNKKGNGTKARHKFVKDDGRSLNIILTEAKGKLTVRATLSEAGVEGVNEAGEPTKEAGSKQVGKVKQFDVSERAKAEEYFSGLCAEAAEKGWQSRKTGVPQSAFDEIPE